MTNEEAIEILRKNRPTSDPRPCGLELCDAVDMAISALRQQEHFREVTKKVEPMTLDDAIAHLDDTLSDTGHKWSCESCRQEHVQLRAWLAELREIKQNRNEPLTLDELRQIDGEPVWLVNQNGGRWVIMSGAYLWDSRKNADYGKTWLAYRQKPEEVQK